VRRSARCPQDAARPGAWRKRGPVRGLAAAVLAPACDDRMRVSHHFNVPCQRLFRASQPVDHRFVAGQSSHTGNGRACSLCKPAWPRSQVRPRISRQAAIGSLWSELHTAFTLSAFRVCPERVSLSVSHGGVLCMRRPDRSRPARRQMV